MEYNINIITVLIAAFAQFIVGAIWYMPVFGKMWGEIHGFDKISKEKQKEAQREMMPLLFVQFFLGAMSAWGLAYFMNHTNNNIVTLILYIWLGFIVPTTASGVIFGGTEKKWVTKKIAIAISGSLLCLITSGLIFKILG